MSAKHLFTASLTTSLRAGIALIALLLSIWAQWLPGSFSFGNEWLRDQYIRLRASPVPETRLTIIDINESSLEKMGPWPWPRARIADLLEILVSEYGARGAAIDIVLPEPGHDNGDARLTSMAQYAPVVLAQAFDYVSRPLSLRVGEISGGQPANTQSPALPATGYIANHAGLSGARFTGNIGFVPDEDGAIRHIPLLTSFASRQYSTLSLALLQCCSEYAQTTKYMADRDAVVRIPFSRAWAAYTVIPASDILNQQTPAASIAGRLVLIGSSALGLSDRVATPLSASTSGVLVHAAMLSSLLDYQSGLAPEPWPGRWIAILFAILLVAVTTYTLPRLSALSNVTILVSAAVMWAVMAYLISAHDSHLSTTGPLATILFLLVVAIPFDWQIAQRKSRQLLETLRHYVAPAVVDELLRSDLKDPLLPHRCMVTTLIADMEGYTTQVESLSMEESAQLTRDFLDRLTQPVLEHFGTIDKFTGDGLVAFWGAPLPVEDHADMALDAAQKIVKAVNEFSQHRQQNGKSPLRVRIGIESGIAMAGDFGSSARSIYTAVGDSVNVASRLEQMARDFPHHIIIGPGTASMAKRHHFILLGEVTLRGKEKPTTLYTIAT